MQRIVLLATVIAFVVTTTGCQTASKRSVAERASCSSLCQSKQPTEVMLRKISAMGYPYVDLSALSWAKHIDVDALMADFEAEATRLESLLAKHDMKVSNLTYDSFEGRDWADYQKRWQALVTLAVRLDTKLINIMAPPAKAKPVAAVRKLRVLQKIAADAGVILTVETHTNQMTEIPADAKRLCEQVPGLGLTLDPSHYYAGPNQGKPFDELYPYVKGTGLRAGGMSWKTIQSAWGTGPIDFVKIIRKLEAAGYEGYYVSEYIEGFNELDALKQSQCYLDWINATDFDEEQDSHGDTEGTEKDRRKRR